MKKILLVIALFNTCASYAQSFSLSSNNTAGDKTKSVGFFEIDAIKSGVVHHYDVNYILSPNIASNSVQLELSTAFPMILTGKIVDMTGKTVSTWDPGSIGYRYSTKFDVSGFTDGKYQLVIFDQYGTKVTSLPFQKQVK